MSRKYLSEHAVNLYTSNWLMISASQLTSDAEMDEEQRNISNNCHIYIISKLPSVRYCPERFNYENGYISGVILYTHDGKLNELPFKWEFSLLDGATSVCLSDYPHRDMVTLDDEGNNVRYLPASTIAMRLNSDLRMSEFSNLEVLYVGQSFGDGSRTAFERLKSHSTLQKILADTAYESPDDEVYLLMFQYEPYRIMINIDGRFKPEVSDYRDVERFHNIVDTPLSEFQQVCLAEAGLIRYFKPKYNDRYKKTFPSETHKILKECYSLDFSGLAVEINTDEFGFNLFSKVAKPKDHHISNINLVDVEERWGFFHYQVNENEAEAMVDFADK